MFTASFLPDGSAAENKLFNEIQRTSATPEIAYKFLKSIGKVDVKAIAAETQVPTLVLHRKGDLAIPVRFGQDLAAQLPNARIELLEGSNHWMGTMDSDDQISTLIDDFLKTKS
jgi:pimeloyl-ACP methyl ester carboxylesterase